MCAVMSGEATQAQTQRLPADIAGDKEVILASYVRQSDNFKGTSGNLYGLYAALWWGGYCHDTHQKETVIPYPTVRGGAASLAWVA